MAAHRRAPDKTPERRLATLEAAGRLAIPFTTGILVGSASPPGRLVALEAIAASHRRHGHVQEVIVQNFLPKPGTAMACQPPCPPEELRWSIAAARLVLPADVHVQAPPNLSDELAPLLEAGIDDWGGVSPVTADHVNPERAWPALEGCVPPPRRPATRWRRASPCTAIRARPRALARPRRATGVLDRATPMAWPGTSWCSGGSEAPPTLIGEAVGDGPASGRALGDGPATAGPWVTARRAGGPVTARRAAPAAGSAPRCWRGC